MIHKPNPERLLKMRQSRKIFIMGEDGNILTTIPEIRAAIKKIEAREKEKLKSETFEKVAEFKKRAGAK